MNATVLNVADNGNGSIAVYVSFVEPATNTVVNYNNISWTGTPCVVFDYQIPVGDPNYISDMQTQITNDINSRLNTEFVNLSTANAMPALISALQSSLVGQIFTQVTATVGNVTLAANGGISAIASISTSIASTNISMSAGS